MARHAAGDLTLVAPRPPLPPPADRLSDAPLAELLAALRAAEVRGRDDPAARAKLAELRGLYEPFVAALAGHFRKDVPGVWPAEERPDNWRTSAWMRQTGREFVRRSGAPPVAARV